LIGVAPSSSVTKKQDIRSISTVNNLILIIFNPILKKPGGSINP
jgi:hypothetical protein